MKKMKLLFITAMLGFTLASCGDGNDGNDNDALDSMEVGPANENDSYKDTATLVQDTANGLNANPVNDTTVIPQH